MAETLRRMVETFALKREAFVWMDLNDRATGDALILVVVTRLLILVGFGVSLLGAATSISGLEALFRAMLNAAVFWLGYSGITYAAARFMFDGDGGYATVLRVAGFAYPTLLLFLVTGRVFSNLFVAFLVAAIWFLVIVAHGVRAVFDLSLEKSLAASALGLAGWIVVASILGYGLV